MSNPKIRQIYDTLDQLNRTIENLALDVVKNVKMEHLIKMQKDWDKLKAAASNLLDYFANTAVSELEVHPEKSQSGGTYIDGVRV